jgi:hypothetical protein
MLQIILAQSANIVFNNLLQITSSFQGSAYIHPILLQMTAAYNLMQIVSVRPAQKD